MRIASDNNNLKVTNRPRRQRVVLGIAGLDISLTHGEAVNLADRLIDAAEQMATADD